MNTTPERYIGEDSGYHGRHTRRTLQRAKAIVRSLSDTSGDTESLLDVGCNRGLTSQYLLEAGTIGKAIGIELERTTVMPSLRTDPRFTLIEGNISNIEISQRFDIIVYGAVHHHIVRNYGLGAAINILHRLTDHCDRHLFFETGHITEGGKWEWQRALRRYFRTDEEHIFYLLKSIEERVSDFEVIGKFWMHGIRRWLIRIDMRRGQSAVSTSNRTKRHSSDEDYIRTFGRRGQRLISKSTDRHDSPTEFSIIKCDGKRFITKKYLHHTGVPAQEYAIGQTVVHDWAVKACSIGPDGILTFPYIDGTSLRDVKNRAPLEQYSIASQLLRIWKEAKATRICASNSLLIPIHQTTSLLDVVDMNVNNIIISHVGKSPVVRVIDFEPHSNHNLWRNRLHFARMMSALGRNRLWAIRMFIAGYWSGLAYCLTYQLRGIKTRIANRQPSLASILVAESRTLMGGVIRTIPFLREN
jgi:SAM-dependent methyltransferase